MSKSIKLSNAVKYSSKRINVNEISVEDFISTDNLLQNKLGKENAIKLPSLKGLMPSYSNENILVGNIRPYLRKIWFADKESGCSADVLVFDVNKFHYPKFIYYTLFRDDFFDHMMKGSKGTKMPRGDKKQILDFLIPDFEFEEQQKIAKVLSDLDAKIENNNRINAELEAMSKTLYDYWFVQFDFPDANGKPYKTSGGKMVWNAELKRDIPEGWNVNELGNILNTDLGGTPSTKSEKFWTGNIPWLNSGEIANFPIVESEAHITSEAISNSATTLMPAGTCVLSITRHLRPSILAIDACANQSVVGIFESEKFKSSFIYPYLKNEIPRLMTLRSGAQQPHINKGTVDESLIIEPSQPILDRYYKKANPIYNQIINNSFQNQELASLRDWLLPMLMNGQVSVGDVEELGMVAEESARYEVKKN